MNEEMEAIFERARKTLLVAKIILKKGSTILPLTVLTTVVSIAFRFF